MRDRLMKRCSPCGRTYDRTAEHFYRDRSRPDGLGHECKRCKRKRDKVRQQTPEYKARDKARRQTPKRKTYNRKYCQTRKRIVIEAYGGCCIACRETDLNVLETHHINGDGTEQRSKQQEQGRAGGNIDYLYGEYRRTGEWPPDIEVRCRPCHRKADAELRRERKQAACT